MSDFDHISVLAREVVELLAPRPDGVYCDGTLGAGGHTAALLEASSPTGRLISLDRDPDAIARGERRFADQPDRARLVCAAFADVADVLDGPVDGFVLDLGLSSIQLDDPERGFAFSTDGPIDMRMDPTGGHTALDVIRTSTVDDLADILFRYGEERYSRRIAPRLKELARRGELSTTKQLAAAVDEAIPAKAKRHLRIHSATRTFQALRIAVNQELEQLERFLDVFSDLLSPGGRCAIISFHSLEDRMVKRRFRDLAKTSSLPPDLARKAGERVDPICNVITRKPVIPSEQEIEDNPRSRSAKLRACEKVAA